MRIEGEETLALLADSARAFMEDFAARKDASPEACWTAMAELGWQGLLLPEAVGGSGLDLAHAAALMEIAGENRLETPLLTGAFLPSLILAQFLDAGPSRSIAERIAAGASQVPLAWQEKTGEIGPDTPSAVLSNDKLSGGKLFVPHFSTADALIVSARRDDGTLVLVALPGDAAGVVATALAMSDGSDAANLAFADARPGDHQVVAGGPDALRAVQTAIRAGALLRSAQLSGLARRTLRRTIAYLHERSQFDRKLSSFQVLQHRAVDLYGLTRLADSSWRSALGKFLADPLATRTQAAVSAAKARSGDVATQVAKAAIQLHGAFGFTEASGMGDVLGTSLAWSASFGNAEAHRRNFHLASRKDLAA